MTGRPSPRSVFVLLLFAVTFAGCDRPPRLALIQVIPDSPQLITGQTVQFKAIGTYVRVGHPSDLRDITMEATWTSSVASVATIAPTGLATSVGSGNTTILATVGAINGSASLTVSGGQAAHDLTSISVIPTSQSLTTVGEPTQFIAIGTYSSAPFTADLTTSAVWHSSDVNVASINSTGLAIANSTSGQTTITASATSTSGSLVTGTATLSVSSPAPPPGGGGSNLPELTIYLVGLGNGTVTTPDGVINCSTVGGSGCTGSFVLGTTVTLTATPAAGSKFGGWSANCTPDTALTCTIVLNNNEPVGAIFNQ